MRSLAIIVALLASFGAGPSTQPSPVKLPPKEQLHIYMLMGQSNMVGRDTHGMDSQKDDTRILALNADGQWVVARDPLHAPNGRIAPGVGPGMSFAAEMLKADPNITIGLVPCAVGGTPLKRWVKGGDLYEKAVKQGRTAAEAGVICGVLWHQGETDGDKKDAADSYQARLTKMFQDLREDLNTPGLPIVVGQLGPFLQAAKHPYVDTVKAALKAIPSATPRVGFADSDGLEHKGDELHFNAESQRTFGTRYAKAMQELQKK
jgi:hypothetical protein